MVILLYTIYPFFFGKKRGLPCYSCFFNVYESFRKTFPAILAFFFSLGETGVRTQGFALAKQALYHVSHTFSPFCSGYFGNVVSLTICPGWV
jgi:hypothetical protein